MTHNIRENTKVISLQRYIDFFKDIHNNPDVGNQYLFYRQTPEGIIITFSADNFIVVVPVKMREIFDLYKDHNFTDSELLLGEEEDHPAVVKFKQDIIPRAIREERIYGASTD